MRCQSQISPAPSERVPVKCLRAAMYCESGVQAGLLRRRKLSFVTCCGFLPSRSMIQMLSPPERSEVNAIHLPSGE